MTVILIKQEGHVVMNLKYKIPVTRKKVDEIPVNYLVIKSMDKMKADDKITILKFENKSRSVITYQLLVGRIGL